MENDLTYHDVVLPGRVVGELNPGTDRVEIILGEDHASPEPDDVVVTGHEVDTLVIHLAVIHRSGSDTNSHLSISLSSYQPSTVSLAIIYLESLCSTQI